jgi:hypothetical protein
MWRRLLALLLLAAAAPLSSAYGSLGMRVNRALRVTHRRPKVERVIGEGRFFCNGIIVMDPDCCFALGVTAAAMTSSMASEGTSVMAYIRGAQRPVSVRGMRAMRCSRRRGRPHMTSESDGGGGRRGLQKVHSAALIRLLRAEFRTASLKECHAALVSAEWEVAAARGALSAHHAATVAMKALIEHREATRRGSRSVWRAAQRRCPRSLTAQRQRRHCVLTVSVVSMLSSMPTRAPRSSLTSSLSVTLPRTLPRNAGRSGWVPQTIASCRARVSSLRIRWRSV